MKSMNKYFFVSYVTADLVHSRCWCFPQSSAVWCTCYCTHWKQKSVFKLNPTRKQLEGIVVFASS